jgi:putative thioredoxin
VTELKHVFDGTRENFPQLVVENSDKGPVLVNYWTPDVGPCFRLWQVLESLSKVYQGRFLLVNVNTDTQKSLVRENGITSVPTVKVYYQGAVVESIYGAQSEATLRKLIDRYAAPAQDSAIARAIGAYQAGQVDEALIILVEAGTREPDNIKLHATAIKLLLREQRYADIERYIGVLPDGIRTRPEIGVMQVHAKMLQLAQEASPLEQLDKQLESAPNDLDAAMSRAAVAMVQDDYATALEHLLQVFRQDRHYSEGLPHKAMQVIFSLLGEQHELTKAGRKAIREALH